MKICKKKKISEFTISFLPKITNFYPIFMLMPKIFCTFSTLFESLKFFEIVCLLTRKKLKKQLEKIVFLSKFTRPPNQGKIVPPGTFQNRPYARLAMLRLASLQALHLAIPKGTIWGEYYFTLTKTPPNPVDIYFVHFKTIFSKNLLFSHFL